MLKRDVDGAEADLSERLLDTPDVLARFRYIFAETHEDKIPGRAPRVENVRQRTADLALPVMNLNWH
ncbi:MAG: hypothetical protein AAGA70_11440 [Pseudomonadota bacterium]